MLTNDGLPIFDATGAVITLNLEGQQVDHIRNMVTTTPGDGSPNDGASPPRAPPQPPITIRFSALIYCATSQAVMTNQAPITTPKFYYTPDCANKK